MDETYFLKIKKDYAAELIRDLEKADAIELTEPIIEDVEIADWQRRTVLARLEEAKKHPERLLNREDAQARMDRLIG